MPRRYNAVLGPFASGDVMMRRALILLVLSLTVPEAGLLAQAVQPTGSSPVARGFRTVTLVEGLEHPWGLAFLPDGSMLITERPGRLRLVRDGKLIDPPISGVPAVLAFGQGGLMDVSLSPDFQQDNLVYLCYSAGTRNANRTTLARGVLDLQSMALRDVQVLFEASPPKSGGAHFGSRIVWLADGTLLLSIGDGGNPPQRIDGTLAREHGQRMDSHLAKVLRLNADGSVPQDNPFVGQDGVRPEIYSIGHRNIQGMARDPESGRIWATEHGPRGGDELNLIVAGENYAWPLASYGREYSTGARVAPVDTLPGTMHPKAVWTPSKAPSGLAFYTGDKFPQWRGNLLSGGLMSQEVRRIILDGERVTGQESIRIGQRVRDVRQGPDGYLYVLTDHGNGRLIRIEPEGEVGH
jgi:glucose/arabinose dehydrogenase